jgi:hypothetical protein
MCLIKDKSPSARIIETLLEEILRCFKSKSIFVRPQDITDWNGDADPTDTLEYRFSETNRGHQRKVPMMHPAVDIKDSTNQIIQNTVVGRTLGRTMTESRKKTTASGSQVMIMLIDAQRDTEKLQQRPDGVSRTMTGLIRQFTTSVNNLWEGPLYSKLQNHLPSVLLRIHSAPIREQKTWIKKGSSQQSPLTHAWDQASRSSSTAASHTHRVSTHPLPF